MTSIAIEVAPFTLAEGVTESALLAASDRLEREFLAGVEGYLGRLLVRKDENSWSDIAFWQSADHARKAMKAVETSEACGGYFQCMANVDLDDPDHGVSLFETVKRYGITPG